MALLWPGALILWGLIPVLAVIYWWILRRRRRFALRYSSLALIREALPRPSRLRQHLPFILLLVALFSLTFALSRPVSIVSVPTNRTTIILTIDVSRSMCSTDIAPNRLVAAERAALAFIQSQQARTQIGIVAFSGFAELIQPPTNDQEMLDAAIESLTTGRRTAIGSGILKAIDAIAESDPSVAPSTTDANGNAKPTPVAPGAYVPNIIVLLTDGVSNTGPVPEDAAQQAADRGVRVYTIGFGTADGAAMPNCSSQYQGREPFGGGPQFFGGGGGGGGGFGGGGFRRGIDEDTLKQVADITGGKYYSAESATELQDVFRSLPTYLIVKHETTEISALFAALGLLLATLAVVLSLLWHPLP